MRFRLPDNTVVRVENPFTYEGIQYPAYWLKDSVSQEVIKAELIIEQPMPDTRLGEAREDPENPGQWLYSEFPKERKQEVLMNYAADKRWWKERYIADERTQNVLTAVWASAKLDPEFQINWKLGSGIYVSLDSGSIIAMAETVREGIQACFDLNKQVDEKILADEITTFEQIDEYFA